MFTRLTIELTNHCNLLCVPCSRHYINMPLGYMDESLFYHLIDQLPKGTTIFPFWRGESLLHPQLIDLLYYAVAQKMNIILATNGTLFPIRDFVGLLDHLAVVSVSLHNMDSYEGYVWLLEQLHKLHAPKTRIEVSLVDGELVDIPQKITEKLSPRLYQYHTIGGHWGMVSESANPNRTWCSRLDTDLVITWNGQVSRCCYVWEPIPGLDASTKPLDEIWDSSQLLRIREFYPDNICQECDQWQGQGRSL